MPRDGVKVTTLERQLGFKWPQGFSRARKESAQLPALKLLLTGIDQLKKRYEADISAPLSDLPQLRQEIDELFKTVGADLWPHHSADTSAWLVVDSCDWDGLWPRYLEYNDLADREILRQHFHQLVYAKCLRHFENQKQAKKRKKREETEADVPSDPCAQATKRPEIEQPYARQYVTPSSSSRGQITRDATMPAPVAQMIAQQALGSSTFDRVRPYALPGETIDVSGSHNSSPERRAQLGHRSRDSPSLSSRPSALAPTKTLIESQKHARTWSTDEGLSAARAHKSAKLAATVNGFSNDHMSDVSPKLSALPHKPGVARPGDARYLFDPATEDVRDNLHCSTPNTATFSQPASSVHPSAHSPSDNASSWNQSFHAQDAVSSISSSEQRPQSRCPRFRRCSTVDLTTDTEDIAVTSSASLAEDFSHIAHGGLRSGTTTIQGGGPARLHQALFEINRLANHQAVDDQGVMKVETEDELAAPPVRSSSASHSIVTVRTPVTEPNAVATQAVPHTENASTLSVITHNSETTLAGPQAALHEEVTSGANADTAGVHTDALEQRAAVQAEDASSHNTGSATATAGWIRRTQDRSQGLQPSTQQPSAARKETTPPPPQTATQPSSSPASQKMFNIKLITNETRLRVYVRVSTDTTVEALFEKVQQRVNRRLEEQPVVEIELQPDSAPPDSEFFGVQRDDPDTWYLCVKEFSQLPGEEVGLHGRIVV